MRRWALGKEEEETKTPIIGRAVSATAERALGVSWKNEARFNQKHGQMMNHAKKGELAPFVS